MARIRTIKPEFFTSEDICSLSPLARLLYVALWCEADKEGRMVWKPRTFKLRYLPADDCDIDALCGELISAGVVELYGDGYACIPRFAAHQHINPRESASVIPSPDASQRVDDACITRRDASARVDDAPGREAHAQGGREGKGKEGEEHRSPSGERFARAPEDDPGDADPVIPSQTDAPRMASRLLEPTETGAAAKALREAGVPDAAPHRPELRAALADGIPVAEIADTARELAVAKPHPKLAYVLATVRGRRADAGRSPTEKLHAAKAHPGRESASDRVARINREAEARERIGSGRIIEGGLGHAA